MYQEIKLISKRNQVFRIIDGDKTYISKTFSDRNDLIKEYEILNLLKESGLTVPKVLEKNNTFLILEDLGKETMLDTYEKLEKISLYNYSDLISKLCKWLKKFYDAMFYNFKQQHILSDVNFRNFIIKDDKIYGIDFEQVQAGRIEDDAGKLAAYALTYDPIMTKWKNEFVYDLIHMFVKELNIDERLLIKAKEKELQDICKRRNITI